jgi:hypothetical protein
MRNQMTSACILMLTLTVIPAAGQPFGFSIQSNGNQHLYSIDLATGAATDVGLVGFADGEGLGGVGNTVYAIGGAVNQLWDVTTPPGTLIGPVGVRTGLDAGLDYDYTSGTMYNVNASSGTSGLYTIDLTTGATTLVGTSSVFSDGLAIDATGQAFGTDWIFSDGLYSVDLTTGAMTFVGPFNVGNVSLQAGASFDASGTLWCLTSDGRIWTINAATGAATQVSTISVGGGFEGLYIPAFGLVDYQVNQPASSLDIDGVIGTSMLPATVLLGLGQTRLLSLSSTNLGRPFEIAFGVQALIPASQGAFVLPDGQIFNVNLADPSHGFLFNFFQSPGFSPIAAPVSSPTFLTLSLQMGNVDPASASGLSLSQPTRLIIQ